MSPQLHSLCFAVRATFTSLASLALRSVALLASLMAFDISQAWAGSQSGWAPMCDLDATSAIAPLIAPPVESGEITVCPDGTVWADLDQSLLSQGGAPAGGPEPTLGLDAPAPRVLPALVDCVPRFVGEAELLMWPDTDAGPQSAFARALDRPPCR